MKLKCLQKHRGHYVLATQTSIINYSYDPAGRMIAKASDTYEYDNDGNLIKSLENNKETDYVWNSDNRFVKVEKVISSKHFTKRAVEEYTYLPEDWRRISRLDYTSFNCKWGRKNHTATTVKNKYFSVYDGEDESHGYWKSPSFMHRAWRWGRYCWKPKLPKYILKREYIGGPYSDDIDITKYHNSSLYMLKDALGSTISLANRGGKNIARIGYDAWGNFRYPDNKNLCRHNPWAMGKYFAAHLSPYLYAGRKYNQFTRQYFNRNRFYQPKYGRFTSKDPIGFSGDSNLYRYANDNPQKWFDPWGFAPKPCDMNLTIWWNLPTTTDAERKNYSEPGLNKDPLIFETLLGIKGVGKGFKTGKNIWDWINAGKDDSGLTTPNKYFGNKTYEEAEKALTKKFGKPRGGGPDNKSFFDKATGRTYNLHRSPSHRGGRPHIDIKKRGLSNNYYKDRPFFLKE